jgi:hypothetical protein
MYLRQVKDGVEEYMQTDWTNCDATVDRAINRLDKKILDKMWHLDESWDLIRMVDELRRIRDDNPEKASRINLDIFHLIDGLTDDFPSAPSGVSILEGPQSQDFMSSLRYFRRHMNHLCETNQLERKEY